MGHLENALEDNIGTSAPLYFLTLCSVLIGVSSGMMKHHDQKHAREERFIWLTHPW